MSVEWAMQMPVRVLARIKTEFSATIKAKYGMKNWQFSNGSSGTAPAEFPYVVLKTLPAAETGMTLERTGLNGVLFSFQVDVIDNAKQQNAKEIMTEIMRIMKTMSFEIVGMPTFEDNLDEHRSTARFRRNMAKEDIL